MRKPGRFGGAGALTGLVGAAAVLSATHSFGALYVTPAGSSDSNGSVDASASIVVGNGTVTVTLTDLLPNPTSSGQTLSGIEFTVSGASGTAKLASSGGDTSTINSDGTYSPGVFTSPLTHWGADNSVNLSTIGIVGKMPFDLIIGPDSAGGFTGAGIYSSANGGLANFNPYVLGSATFMVDVPGVTAGSTLSGSVDFEFGTSNPADELVTGMLVTAIPEPAMWAWFAAAFALVPLGAGILRGPGGKRLAA